MVDLGGSLLMPGVRRGTVTVDRYQLGDGTCEPVASATGVIGSFDTAGDGHPILAAVSTPTRPAELWEFADGEFRVIRSLNDELLDTLDIPTSLEAIGVESARIREIAEKAHTDAAAATNPRAASIDEIETILQNAFTTARD